LVHVDTAIYGAPSSDLTRCHVESLKIWIRMD